MFYFVIGRRHARFSIREYFYRLNTRQTISIAIGHSALCFRAERPLRNLDSDPHDHDSLSHKLRSYLLYLLNLSNFLKYVIWKN